MFLVFVMTCYIPTPQKHFQDGHQYAFLGEVVARAMGYMIDCTNGHFQTLLLILVLSMPFLGPVLVILLAYKPFSRPVLFQGSVRQLVSASQFLLGPSHPRVAWTPNRQGKGTRKEWSTQRPSDNNSRRAFSNDQKVVTVQKTRGIYTPNPRGTFTFLPIHFQLISALSEPQTSHFSPCNCRAVYITQTSPNRDRHASAVPSRVPQKLRARSLPRATDHWFRIKGLGLLRPSFVHGRRTFGWVTSAKVCFQGDTPTCATKREIPEIV